MLTDEDKPFLLPIEGAIAIAGRGTLVTGRVERGIIRVNDEVEIIGIKDTVTTLCTGIVISGAAQEEGRAGAEVGVLLRGIRHDDIERGQVLAKPGSIRPRVRFEAEVQLLSTEECGRETPFFSGYRPKFCFRTAEVTGTIDLPEGVDQAMPGETVHMYVHLISPIALEDGLRFEVRENGRTIATGVILEVQA